MQYFIKRNEKVNGPFTEAQIKKGFTDGTLKDRDLISKSKDGSWKPLGQALGESAEPATPEKGGVGDEEIEIRLGSASKAPIPAQNQAEALTEKIEVPEKGGVGDEEIYDWLGIASKAPIPAQNQADELPEQIVVANTPEVSHQNIPQRQTKDCPFCAEPIAVAAIKCKHCGEMLDSQDRQHVGASRGPTGTTQHESYSDDKIEFRDSSLYVKKFYNPLTRQELTSDSSLSYSEITSVNTTRGATCGVGNYLDVGKNRRIFYPLGVGMFTWALLTINMKADMGDFKTPVMEILLGVVGFFCLCVPSLTEFRVKRGSKEVDVVTIKFSSGKDTVICYEPGKQVNKVAELIRARVS